jgi:hypothetical protein
MWICRLGWWRASRGFRRRSVATTARIRRSLNAADPVLHCFGVFAAEDELVKGSTIVSHYQPSQRVVMDDGSPV